MLSSLQNNVIAAIILVLIIILGALGVRSGLLVGISIPGSFLSGILALSVMGFTINIVVLFALILSIGLLVDGAIVVVEYADRKLKEGLSIKEAYANASKKMALPIISSTATTLAAFLPLIFWPGLAGEFMKYLPITLICVLTSSLFMALLFVPVLGSVLNILSRIFLQVIIPLIFALIIFNLISYSIKFNNINYLYFPLTIIKFVIPLLIYIFIFIKIIPRVYKITEKINSYFGYKAIKGIKIHQNFISKFDDNTINKKKTEKYKETKCRSKTACTRNQKQRSRRISCEIRIIYQYGK